MINPHASDGTVGSNLTLTRAGASPSLFVAAALSGAFALEVEMDIQNRDLLITARKAILRGNPKLAISCIDLVLEDSRVERLKRFYERAGLVSPIVVNKKYGKRSAFGYIHE